MSLHSVDTRLLRPTEMIIDLDAIRHNLSQIRARVGSVRIMGIVKANAYGHGLVPVAKTLVGGGIDALGVALVEEGIELREGGIQIPVLVFGGIFTDQIPLYLKHNLDLTASSVEKLYAIDAVAASLGVRARVHLKIDTGMGRIGVQYSRASSLLEATRRCRSVDVVGVFSHLATGEDSDTSFAQEQMNRFRAALSTPEASHLSGVVRHIANSGGLLSLSSTHLDMVRPGLLLYGVAPAAHLETELDLRPAMTLRSQVVYFKVLPPGAGVSYGHTWRADRQTRIVTIPLGYGDGFFRRLSNRGFVLIRGKRYPIVGNVCMDQMMVDIGDGEAYNGDEVILIGSQGSERITVSEVASIADTVEHEVLTSTNLRVPRSYRGGSP